MRTSFYCTVRDGNRTGFLLGPFGSLSQAEGSVPLARRLAERADPWSAFYRFGVASLPVEVPVQVRFDVDSVATFGKQTVRAYHHA